MASLLDKRLIEKFGWASREMTIISRDAQPNFSINLFYQVGLIKEIDGEIWLGITRNDYHICEQATTPTSLLIR